MATRLTLELPVNPYRRKPPWIPWIARKGAVGRARFLANMILETDVLVLHFAEFRFTAEIQEVVFNVSGAATQLALGRSERADFFPDFSG